MNYAYPELHHFDVAIYQENTEWWNVTQCYQSAISNSFKRNFDSRFALPLILHLKIEFQGRETILPKTGNQITKLWVVVSPSAKVLKIHWFYPLEPLILTLWDLSFCFLLELFFLNTIKFKTQSRDWVSATEWQYNDWNELWRK